MTPEEIKLLGNPAVITFNDGTVTVTREHYRETMAALKQIIEAADNPDNEKNRDFVDAINFEGIRKIIA